MADYTQIINPRVSDINYYGHLGHTELLNLLHEVRVQFLHKLGLSEINISGHALIMRRVNITYSNQAFWNNELKVDLSLNCDNAKIIFNYSVFNLTLNNKTAEVETVMVLLDKEKHKPVRPDILIEIINDRIKNIKNTDPR